MKNNADQDCTLHLPKLPNNQLWERSQRSSFNIANRSDEILISEDRIWQGLQIASKVKGAKSCFYVYLGIIIAFFGIGLALNLTTEVFLNAKTHDTLEVCSFIVSAVFVRPAIKVRRLITLEEIFTHSKIMTLLRDDSIDLRAILDSFPPS